MDSDVLMEFHLIKTTIFPVKKQKKTHKKKTTLHMFFPSTVQQEGDVQCYLLDKNKSQKNMIQEI